MAVYDSATQAKLEELGRLWNQATNAGNTAQADYYHLQANDIRNNAGLKAGVDYDSVTGASLKPVTTVATNSKANEVLKNVQDAKNWINTVKANTGQPASSSNGNMQSIIDNIWNQVNSMVSSARPTTTTTDYSSVLAELKAQTDPLHQQKLAELEKASQEAEASLRNQMAGAGAYDSSTMDKRLAQLKGDYLTGAANEDAQYENNLATLANSVYQMGLSRDASAQGTYQQIVASLAQAYMSGSLDLAKFASNMAYQEAVLARMYTNDYLGAMG